MRNTQDQLEGMKDENYPSLGGGDKRSEILKVRWKGWKIRDTQGQRERMNDQEYSYQAEVVQIGNTPGWLEWMEDQKY